MNKMMCNNCGKLGHPFHQCKLPITSYGIILFRMSSKGLQYLMIRRKDTFGYVDFIRGKYLCNDTDHIQSLFDEMSVTEKQTILNTEFMTLWSRLWGNLTTNGQYKHEEIVSQKKFDQLKEGIYKDTNKDTYLTSKQISLQTFVQNSSTQWSETEWEFPKGRRNAQEKDIDCALREFEEETGLFRENICVAENILPMEEIYLGSNHKSYKHKFFLAYTTDSNYNNIDNYQRNEVSKIEWKTYNECIQSMRPYNVEKKQLITNVHTLLQRCKWVFI